MSTENKKWAYVGYCVAWISVAIGVVVAINVTKSIGPLWAFLIPCFITIN